MKSPSKKTLMLAMLFILALFGGALLYFTMEYLSSVTQENSAPTPETVQQIGLLFLVITMMAGFPAVGMGAYVMYIGSRIRATGQWPPAGMGFRSTAPVVLGSRTNLVGIGAMVLGGILLIGGLMLPLLGWRVMNLFSA